MSDIKAFDPNDVIEQNDINDENRLVDRSYNLEERQNFMIEKIMQTWQKQQSTDRALRSNYAKYFLGILVVELLAIMGIMVAVGFGYLVYNVDSLNLFLAGTIMQIFLSIRIAVKYLFSRDSNVGLEDIVKITENISKRSTQ